MTLWISCLRFHPGKRGLKSCPWFRGWATNPVQGPRWSFPQIWRLSVWGFSLSIAGAENDFPSLLVISGGNQSVLQNQHIIWQDAAWLAASVKEKPRTVLGWSGAHGDVLPPGSPWHGTPDLPGGYSECKEGGFSHAMASNSGTSACQR